MKRIAFIIALGGFFFIHQINAQQIRTYTTSEADSMACIQNYSLYSEFVKQKNFVDALPGWRKSVAICPKMSEAHYQNGEKIMDNLIANTEDEALKSAYIDTLMWVHDQRIKYFGKEGYVLERKGVDLAKLRKDDPKTAHEVLARSLELRGNKMGASGVIYVYKTAYDMYRKKMADKELLFDLYPKVSAVIDHNMANGDERAKKGYTTAQSNVDKMFSKVAECPDLIGVYTPKFEANPGDEALLRQIIKFFEKQECTDEELYQQAAVKLYEIDPSAVAAYAIANGYAKKQNYTEAVKFFVKATETDDEELKFKAMDKAANTYLLTGDYISARSYANKMLEMNPNSGGAYIIIGNAYVKGRNKCGGNECTNRAAYWAAVDKFQKAKSVDPSVAEKAQKLINTYTGQFPKKEDCFFHSINEGDSYTLDCWIGVTTTVRTRSN